MSNLQQLNHDITTGLTIFVVTSVVCAVAHIYFEHRIAQEEKKAYPYKVLK